MNPHSLWLGLLTCKTVSRITYTVLVETLNPAQSNPIPTHSMGGYILLFSCGVV